MEPPNKITYILLFILLNDEKKGLPKAFQQFEALDNKKNKSLNEWTFDETLETSYVFHVVWTTQTFYYLYY